MTLFLFKVIQNDGRELRIKKGARSETEVFFEMRGMTNFEDKDRFGERMVDLAWRLKPFVVFRRSTFF